MATTLPEFLAESSRSEQAFNRAFDQRNLESLDNDFLQCYASVLESHERRITIGMCDYPFVLTRASRRSPGYFQSEDSFHAKLAITLPTAAKHEYHYLNSSGAWHGLSDTAKKKSVPFNDTTATLSHARYLGLSWALKRVGDQIQLARFDYFTQVVESGTAVAKSLSDAFEASATGVYSDQYTKGLSTLQTDFRKFLASETAKQQAKAAVFGEAAASKK